MLTLSAPAHAQFFNTASTDRIVEVESADGWYLTIGAGANWPSTMQYQTRGTIRFFEDNGNLDFGGGFSGDIGIGYDFGTIRTELTYAYSNSSINNVTGAAAEVSGSSNFNKNDILFSVYADLTSNSRFTPYIGGGIGYSNLNTPGILIPAGVSTVGTPIPRDLLPRERIGDGSAGVFGWQAKAGVSYAFTSNWDGYVEGVYSGASGFATNNVDYDPFNTWGAKLGFRYRFAKPPMKVMAVPEPVRQPPAQAKPDPVQSQPQVQPTQEPIRGLW